MRRLRKLKLRYWRYARGRSLNLYVGLSVYTLRLESCHLFSRSHYTLRFERGKLWRTV